MSTGGGTTTTNTVQNSAPWGPMQPYLTDLASQAQSLQASQQGQTAMPSSVAGFSPVTQQALDATAQRAMTGSPLVSAADQSANNLMTPGMAPGMATLTGQLSGYADPGNAYAMAGAGSNPALNQAANILAANSGPNPYLDQMYQAASQPVIDQVNAQFGLAGRTGSAANQQELTRDLGNLAGNIYGSNYLAEQQLGQNAASQLASIGQNLASRQLTAGNQLSANALNQANISANAANALNSQYNTGNNLALSAAGLAPQLASLDYTDLQNLLNVGGAYDALNQNVLNNQLQQWQYAQQQPWNILNAYGGVVSGLGALGGTSSGSSSQTVPGQSLIPTLIGSGAKLLSYT